MPEQYDSKFKEVSATLYGADNLLLETIVEVVAEIAQENARRDTGFYAENIVPLVGGQGRAAKFEARYSPKEGRVVPREAAAYPALDEGQAAVVALAVYSYFIEREDDTIANAFQYGRAQFDSIVGQVRARLNLGEG